VRQSSVNLRRVARSSHDDEIRPPLREGMDNRDRGGVDDVDHRNVHRIQ
jgi:hypothetical protein